MCCLYRDRCIVPVKVSTGRGRWEIRQAPVSTISGYVCGFEQAGTSCPKVQAIANREVV